MYTHTYIYIYIYIYLFKYYYKSRDVKKQITQFVQKYITNRYLKKKTSVLLENNQPLSDSFR